MCFKTKQVHLTKKKIEFWSYFGLKKFTMAYTRVDLHASIYGMCNRIWGVVGGRCSEADSELRLVGQGWSLFIGGHYSDVIVYTRLTVSLMEKIQHF